MCQEVRIEAKQRQGEHCGLFTEHLKSSQEDRYTEQRTQKRGHNAGRDQGSIDAIHFQKALTKYKALSLERSAGIRRLGHFAMKKRDCAPHLHKRRNLRIESEV